MKKIKKKCYGCKFLYTDYGSKRACFDEDEPKMYRGVCDQFKAGRPFIPRIDGKLAKLINVDPKREQAFILYTSDNNALVLWWSLGDNNQGHWRVRQIGLLPDGGIATKEFGPAQVEASFAGEVEIISSGLSALFTSFGFEDRDERDEEGNISNKPREIRITPARLDRKKR